MQTIKNLFQIITLVFLITLASIFVACIQTESNEQFSVAASSLPLNTPASPTEISLAAQNSIVYTWKEQGVSISFPSGWDSVYEKPTGFSWNTFFGRDKAQPADAVWLSGIVTIGNKTGTFEGMNFKDALDYEYAENIKDKGKYTEVSWLTVDGVTGMFTCDEKSNDSHDLRHLQWKCYRIYKGEHQILEFSAYTSGKTFNRNEDEMKKLLASLKFTP